MDEFPYLRPTIHTASLAGVGEEDHLKRAVSSGRAIDSGVRVLQIVVCLEPKRAIGQSILVRLHRHCVISPIDKD